ncbi:MAG: 16S rRNA (cytosine(1402)-N(4))-methyltransferase RsmH [Firmicutes bacterium]|nr:16S rRNA (cytosine(1402)-N(4))-methyltransferase RsmH [Bacillota bacterium]
MDYYHTPVLLEEVLEYLNCRPGGTYIDATVGEGGHAAAILEKSGPEGRIIGLDQDPEAIRATAEKLAGFGPRAKLYNLNFRRLQEVAAELDGPVDGVLFDLGVSSRQLDLVERGFTYREEGPLDMRMNLETERTAAELVNHLPERELSSLIYRYGEERWASRIARFILAARKRGPISTTRELVEIIKAAIPAAARRKGPHPAKRTFQALRIAVNDELGALQEGVRQAVEVLSPGGRLVVISFHSLEDGKVKGIFREFGEKGNGQLRIITRKPVLPREEEVTANPRARSAKLRAAEKAIRFD